MPTARLNVFQRLAQTWDAVHPYNAGQACRVAGAFDRTTVERAWRESLGGFGFSAPDARLVDAVAPGEDLARHFTREMNRPFADAGVLPFRAFVQDAGGSLWFGVAYRHWVADSYAVRLLLREWIERANDTAGQGSRGTGHAYGARHAGFEWVRERPAGAPGRVGSGSAIGSVLSLLRRYGEYRRCRKVHTMGALDYAVRVRLVDVPGGLVPPLLAYARARGVKLNDVFLAALAEACGRFVPAQERRNRTGLAVSSVADLRPTLPRHERHHFGCHLGFGGVACRARDLRDWDPLLRRVAAGTAAERAAQAGTLWMLAAEAASRVTPPRRVYGFYRKEAPFVGGVSNVNLRDSWFDRNHPGRVLDYMRVSPTGPIVPVALNVTTLGDDLRLTMTYRSNLLNDWTAGELARTFVGRLRRVAC